MDLPSLPDEVIGNILSFLPLRSRLACASVCQRLLQITTAVTSSLALSRPDQARADSFSAYLQHYGKHVRVLNVENCRHHVQLQSCTQLEQLSLSGCVLSQCQDGNWGLFQCTALTRLDITSCSIEAHKSVALTQLTAFQSLQQLSLSNVSARRGSPTPLPVAAREWVPLELPVGLLPHLSCLTSLRICTGVLLPDSALLQLTAVSNLRALELTCLNITTAAVGALHQLQQLTYLRLWAHQVSISLETTPSFSKLTALQTLMLFQCSIDPRVLAGLSNLQTLGLAACPAQPDGAARLLAVLPKLQKLRSIGLSSTRWQWPAVSSAYRGLAASSQLTSFEFIYCTVPVGAWHFVFAPGQHLTQLQELSIVHDYDDDTSLIQGLLLSTRDIQNIVTCCPGLRSVSVMLQCTAELPSLTQLSALSSLSVVGVSAAGLRSIAGLTGLSDLKLQSTEWARISWEGLLPVTAPRQLTRLMRSPYDEGVSTDADEEEGREANVYLVDLRSCSSGRPPNVWAQLVQTLAGQRIAGPLVVSSLAQQLVQAEGHGEAMQQQLEDAHKQVRLQRQQLEAQRQAAARQQVRMEEQLALLEANSAGQAVQLVELQQQVQQLASIVQGQHTSLGGVSMY